MQHVLRYSILNVLTFSRTTCVALLNGVTIKYLNHQLSNMLLDTDRGQLSNTVSSCVPKANFTSCGD